MRPESLRSCLIFWLLFSFLLLSTGMIFADEQAAKLITESQVNKPAVLRSGTQIHLKTTKEMVSGVKPAGSWVELVVTRNVTGPGGVVLIKEGAYAYGRVVRSKNRKMAGQQGKLEFTVDYVRAADGSKVPLTAREKKAGRSNMAAAVVGSLLIFSPICYVRGRDAVVAAGTPVTAYVDEDTIIFAGSTEKGTPQMETPSDGSDAPEEAAPEEAQAITVKFLSGRAVKSGKPVLLQITPQPIEKALSMRIVFAGQEKINCKMGSEQVELDTTGVAAGVYKIFIQVIFQDGTAAKEQVECEVI